MVIADAAKQRMKTLELLTRDMVNYSNAPGTNANKKSQVNRYMEFCNWIEVDPFPADEWRLAVYATYLSLRMSSIETIKGYCGTICERHELNGHPPIVRGKLYNKAIQGIRRLLQHEIKKAQPVTMEMLQQMVRFVNPNDDKQVATWTSILYGFFLFLRKSNLVPIARKHDDKHQLSRQDITYHQGVLVARIKWSKTNQFGEEILPVPVVRKEGSQICPVAWLLYMVRRNPVAGNHNLFSYIDTSTGLVTPVTYHDLTELLRHLLRQIGVQEVQRFSSHSLRRGGTSHAFARQIPETIIQRLGMWASTAYKRYIDLTMESRLKAWYMLSHE